MTQRGFAEVVVPNAAGKASLTIDRPLAELVRRVASAENRPKAITLLVEDMLYAYLVAQHPDWMKNGTFRTPKRGKKT